MAVARTDAAESENVTGNKTLDEGDVGVVQNVTSSATITLSAGIIGRVYTIRNGGSGSSDGAVTITIYPAALSGDKIMGGGITSEADKYIRNTNGRGGLDEITLIADGAAGWYIASLSGNWTREA